MSQVLGNAYTIPKGFQVSAGSVTFETDNELIIPLTRAGSNALSELALVRLPFLAVPLTRGSRGEQVKNARWFAERGMGLVADEKQLENLPRLVQKLYEQRTAIANAQRKFDFYGTEKAAKEILKAAKK